MEFNLFDLGVILIVGLSALLSFFRGFVREVLSLGGWMIASIVTLKFIEPATAFVKPQVKSEVVASGIAAVGLFFITLVVISILANFIVKFLKPGDKVGLFDNLAGLAFGVARGVLIVAIGFFIMNIVVTEKNHPDMVKKSVSAPYVATCAKWLKTLTPEYLDGITGEKKDDAKDDTHELIKKLDAARNKAAGKLEDASEELDEKTEDLPSMEDLQRRIKEENEKNHVR